MIKVIWNNGTYVARLAILRNRKVVISRYFCAKTPEEAEAKRQMFLDENNKYSAMVNKTRPTPYWMLNHLSKIAGQYDYDILEIFRLVEHAIKEKEEFI